MCSSDLQQDEVVLRRRRGLEIPRKVAVELTQRWRGRVSLFAGTVPQIRVHTRGLPDRGVLQQLEQILAVLAQPSPPSPPSPSPATGARVEPARVPVGGRAVASRRV